MFWNCGNGRRQLLALRVAVERLAREQAAERIRHRRGQEIDRRRIADGARREVLPRHRVHVEVGRQIVAPAGDVGALDHPLPRQLALHAERPAHGLAVAIVERVVETPDAAPEEGIGTEAGARRVGDAIRERIGERCANRHAGVERGHDARPLREAGLIDAADVEERGHRVDGPAAAQHGLRIQRIRKAHARLEVVDVGIEGCRARRRTQNPAHPERESRRAQSAGSDWPRTRPAPRS